MSVTDPLREEHRELLPHLETLKAAADAVGPADVNEVRERVEEAYRFLVTHLIPHATAEDIALYPVVGRLMGAEMATRTMSRDHVEVGRLTDQLARLRQRLGSGQVNESEQRELRRVLYGLYTLVQLHFAKEEEIYLPLLDERLDEPSAREMFAAMEAAAASAKSHARP